MRSVVISIFFSLLHFVSCRLAAEIRSVSQSLIGLNCIKLLLKLIYILYGGMVCSIAYGLSPMWTNRWVFHVKQEKTVTSFRMNHKTNLSFTTRNNMQKCLWNHHLRNCKSIFIRIWYVWQRPHVCCLLRDYVCAPLSTVNFLGNDK